MQHRRQSAARRMPSVHFFLAAALVTLPAWSFFSTACRGAAHWVRAGWVWFLHHLNASILMSRESLQGTQLDAMKRSSVNVAQIHSLLYYRERITYTPTQYW